MNNQLDKCNDRPKLAAPETHYEKVARSARDNRSKRPTEQETACGAPQLRRTGPRWRQHMCLETNRRVRTPARVQQGRSSSKDRRTELRIDLATKSTNRFCRWMRRPTESWRSQRSPKKELITLNTDFSATKAALLWFCEDFADLADGSMDMRPGSGVSKAALDQSAWQEERKNTK